MQRLFFLGFVLLLICSCKPKAQEVAEDIVSTFEIAGSEWPKRTAIDFKARPILTGWKEFEELETSFDALYNVENTEDLSLAIDELEVKQKELSRSKFPEQFNIPQIKGRLTMFNTFLLKTKGDLHYRRDVQKSVLEMINAYNALRDQFNIIVNNTLDTKLILEE